MSESAMGEQRVVLLGELVSVPSGVHEPLTALKVHSDTVTGDSPEVAYIIPVHNQAGILERVLNDLEASSVLRHQICLIFDDCRDNSFDVSQRWLASVNSENLTEVIRVTPSRAVFETMADVVGVALTEAPVVIEVQADMFIDDPGFDARMRDWLNRDEQLFAVSGRGAHVVWRRTWLRRAIGKVVDRLFSLYTAHRGTYSASRFEALLGNSVGRVGLRIEAPDVTKKDRLFVHEGVMRGPLAFARSRYGKLGGLDTSRFFLGNDDHDISRRAWSQERWRVAYAPVAFTSPLEVGSTRRERSPQEAAELSRFRAHYAQRTATVMPKLARRDRRGFSRRIV